MSLSNLIVFAAVFLACISGLSAEGETELAPLETYAALPEVDHVRISPDGSRLALLSRASGPPVVVVLTLDGEQLGAVDASAMKPRTLYFATNDVVIMHASDYYEGALSYGRERGFSFAYDVTSNDVNDLLQQERRFTFQRAAGRPLAYSADGETAYVLGIPKSGALRWSVLRTRYDNPRGDLVKRLTADAVSAFIRPDGSVVAHEEFDLDTKRYEVFAHDGNELNSLRRIDDADRIRSFVDGLHPDGDHLVYYAGTDDEAGAGYYKLALGDGALNGRIFDAAGLDIARTIRDRNRVVMGVEYAASRPVYEFLDPNLDRTVQAMVNAFPSASVYLESWSDDLSKMIFRIEGEGMVGDYFLFDADTMETAFLATQRPGIPSENTQPIEVFQYTARDGLEIEAILTGAPPEGAPAKPLILLPHGGPAARDKVQFDWMAQFFASRGYAVLQPNFRGSTGYGVGFREAGLGQWGKAMQTDLTDGVLALAETGRIDPEQVCIIGASYGGYAALMGGASQADAFKCVIAIAPVSDPAYMLRKLKKAGGADSPALAYWKEQLGVERIRDHLLAGQSPVDLADQFTSPVLLLHGDEDQVVIIEHSERMERALRKADKPVKFVVLEEEDHWLSRAETRLQLLQEIDAFLTEHLPIQ